MIGDFGLSKMIRDANNTATTTTTNNRGVGMESSNIIILPPPHYSHNKNNDTTIHHHTAGVGTASYASPEQIASKTYGTAADIYSLGLILLELFSNFTSEHERAKAFHDCRYDRELPSLMKRRYPEVSTLILSCTQIDWRRRPTSDDIQSACISLFQKQQRRGSTSSGAEVYRAELRALEDEMTKKDRLVRSQREELKEKDDIIENLKRRLAELETSPVTK